MKNTWQLQEAKNQLSLVVEDALTKGPQTITRHGKPTVVVVAVKEFQQKRPKRKGIVELFAALKGSGIDLERVRDFPREVKL
ncbi:MAG: type II toxin-antitoxin system prevent-host-death family antitoxin [Pedosphaera sp. Tous-C6FEB]|nr:MAG: type II toxin-antitoxin system prevent-host-death family antitoxin [Pedosphaera sp. Tous-C6FEB]